MKKISILLLVSIFLFGACKQEQQQVAKTTTPSAKESHFITDADMESGVIYEANIRQYSPEGTFNAFAKDIPQLKQLGVKIIWLMPVFPISTTKSKGSLGSYYAVSDYTKINPEFGTIEDFRDLVKTAHDNGLFVILDWVANHTGWDHKWVSEHPEYYTKDEKGNITHTPDTDWTDVADLNYDNTAMRNEMKNAMLYWLKNENIDGFRCDVAGMVPLDFWQSTIAELRKIKPIFMLAEAWKPELMNNAFDMAYGWDNHHRMNEIAQLKGNVSILDKQLTKNDSLYKREYFLMNFVTNHDENSWNGTVKERMGNASEAMLALSYTLPGMPLIYSGQEYNMNKRLRFFEKDTIIKAKGKVWPLLEKLGKLKNENIALHGGKDKASFKRIQTSNDKNVMAFSRSKNGKQLIYIANLSKEPVFFTMDASGNFVDYLTKENKEISSKTKYKFTPWEYKILVK